MSTKAMDTTKEVLNNSIAPHRPLTRVSVIFCALLGLAYGLLVGARYTPDLQDLSVDRKVAQQHLQQLYPIQDDQPTLRQVLMGRTLSRPLLPSLRRQLSTTGDASGCQGR